MPHRRVCTTHWCHRVLHPHPYSFFWRRIGSVYAYVRPLFVTRRRFMRGVLRSIVRTAPPLRETMVGFPRAHLAGFSTLFFLSRAFGTSAARVSSTTILLLLTDRVSRGARRQRGAADSTLCRVSQR